MPGPGNGAVRRPTSRARTGQGILDLAWWRERYTGTQWREVLERSPRTRRLPQPFGQGRLRIARFLTQTSWSAQLRSGKWMSDPASAWIDPGSALVADPQDSSSAARGCSSHLRACLTPGKGDLRGTSVSPLTNPYHGCPRNARIEGSCSQQSTFLTSASLPKPSRTPVLLPILKERPYKSPYSRGSRNSAASWPNGVQ